MNREAFELWFRKEFLPHNMEYDEEHSTYLHTKVHFYWLCWKAALASQAQQPTPSGKPFQTLADLLPDGFMWGDNLTPDAVLHIALAANLKQSQAQQEPIGEVQHYAAPANLPAYVNVKWYGKPPKNGAKVYVLPPAPEGEPK